MSKKAPPGSWHVYAKLTHARCTDNLSVFLAIGDFSTKVLQLSWGLKFEEIDGSALRGGDLSDG